MSNKGLSILIPVYNCDVRSLVKELHEQGEKIKMPFQILVYDDASSVYKKENNEISGLPNVTYCELSSNRGRSAIRNYMASEADYSMLLFLDCDSKIIRPGFLDTYIKRKITPVITGGRQYPDTPPGKKYMLHWKAGRQKEECPPEIRQKKPYNSLMLNNLLIERSLFRDIELDENIKGYGHEDTLLGFHLKREAIPVQHIDNPVLHNELETNEEFLEKTMEGINNLVYLASQGYAGDVKLYSFYLKMKNTGMLSYLGGIEKILYNYLKNSSNPALKILDLWKLIVLHKAFKS